VSEVNVNNLITRGTVELRGEETPAELSARLRREDRRDQREHVMFYVALVGVVLLAGFCAWSVFFADGSDPEQRRWAQTALTILVSGSIGFLTGRRLPAS
jgi:hypothetical protein